jgi:iduronate 2-sulfatase
MHASFNQCGPTPTFLKIYSLGRTLRSFVRPLHPTTCRLHKPHLPHVIPSKYFDLYPLDNVSLPPNAAVPQGFLEENWHANGNMEIVTYANNDAAFNQTDGTFGFNKPVNDAHARELRRGYFAASTFVDAQVGRIMDALDQHSFADNTIVAVWSDHG